MIQAITSNRTRSSASSVGRGAAIVIVIALLSSRAWAEAWVMGDYNVGGAAVIEKALGSGAGAAVGVGVLGNGEASLFANGAGRRQSHWLFWDGRFFSIMGGGAQLAGTDKGALFHMRLMGSFSGGLQAWRVVPLNLSFEDVELHINNSRVNSRSLIGTTVYLPGSSICGFDNQTVTFLGLTAGARLSSRNSASTFALQPKLRFLNNDFSIELSGLVTLSSSIKEQQGKLLAAVNHVFGAKNNQLGVYGRVNDTKEVTATASFLELMLFFGGNL